MKLLERYNNLGDIILQENSEVRILCFDTIMDEIQKLLTYIRKEAGKIKRRRKQQDQKVADYLLLENKAMEVCTYLVQEAAKPTGMV